MSILNIEEDLSKVAAKFSAWKTRLEVALAHFERNLGPTRYKAIIELMRRAHSQAEQALQDSNVAVADGVPWELSHGLSLLGLLDGRKALPTRPEEIVTRVLKDGSLLGCQQWELLDVRWTEALLAWLEHLDNRAPFKTTPASVTIENRAVLAVAGDWGTGPFSSSAPSIAVANAMQAAKPDYSVHLGDVYYAGTLSEENIDMRGWPHGRLGGFTLNSNHEMYSGAIGYYSELAKHFPIQQGTSYFSLHNDAWLIVGLDSAYAADELNLYMDGKLNQAQVTWLGSLPKNKRVVVLSHHQPYDLLGSKKAALYDEVARALGRVPDYWYWGHLHNAVSYAPREKFHGRCAGHGAIPYGNASELAGNTNVSWYETQNAGDKNYPERVLNGFVKISLDGNLLSESFIGEDGSVRWSSAG